MKRKSIIASNLEELKQRGAEKLGLIDIDRNRLKLVLENDGTEVEDESYFQSLEIDTVFILLRDDECWLPPGLEAFKSGNYFLISHMKKLIGNFSLSSFICF